MGELPVCPQCRQPVSPASPGGLCTRCLLQHFGAAGTEATHQQSRSAASGGSQETRFPQTFGDYELLDVLGRGGMGIVYKARQLTANRLVAIKWIAAGDLATPELVRRFRIEAETAASLEHPGIVPVYAVGEFDGRHYFTMQLVRGESLARRLERIRAGEQAPYTQDEAVALIAALAHAVHFAHLRGVLHRDIKPGNVLLDEQGIPRLTDFGLAKVLQADKTASRTQGVLGTPAYMAPEQARGSRAPLTTAIDVYALGVVLYELLTGTRPFDADSSYELLQRIVEDPPPAPSRRNPRIGIDLETVCLKCLAKDPSQRYVTARELADDLERWRTHQPIRARAPGVAERWMLWSRRHPALASLSAAALLAVALFTVQQARHATALRAERDAARAAQIRAETTVIHQRLTHADQLLRAGKTADALTEWARILRSNPTNTVAAARIFSTLSHRSFLLPMAGESVRPLPSFTLEFSPDGRQALQSDRTHTRVLDADRLLPDAESPVFNLPASRACWSPDGTRVALVCIIGGGAWVCDATHLRPLQPLIPLAQWSAPAFSSDGNWLAIAGGEESSIWLQDLSSGRITPWVGRNEAPRNTGAAAVFDLSRILTHTASAIQSWPMQPGPERLLEVAVENPLQRLRSRPGVPVLIGETRNSRISLRSSRTLQPVGPEFELQRPVDDDLRLDGLLYASSNPERWGQLWDLTTGKPMGEPALRACWSARTRFSPDGQRLFLFGDTEGIHVCDARDGRMHSRSLPHRDTITHAEFSADGRRVATASEDGTACVWDVAKGSQVVPPMIHGAKVRSVQFAAGDRFLISYDTANVVRIWDAATGALVGKPRQQQDLIHSAVMDVSGSWLACGTGRSWSLYSMTNNMDAPVFGEAGMKTPSVQFNRDGSRLMTLSIGDAQKDLLHLWEPGNPTPVWTLPELRAQVRAALSEDGDRVAAAGADGLILLWDVRRNHRIGTEMRHKDMVWVMMFSPDGRRLLTAGADRKAQVWDTTTGDPVGDPMLHESPVWQAQFSPDGSRVLTRTAEDEARVWDTETGHPLTESFVDHPVAIHIIMSPSTPRRFSPDGRRVVLPCGDNRVRTLELPPSEPTPSWLPELVEAIAGQQWGEKGVSVKPWADLYAVRDSLSQKQESGEWLAWARWLFADRGQRTVTPYSREPVSEWVEERVAQDTVPALVDALRSQPGHAEARRRLAEHWRRNPNPAHPGQRTLAEHLETLASQSR